MWDVLIVFLGLEKGTPVSRKSIDARAFHLFQPLRLPPGMALSPLSAVALELVDARAGGGLPPPPAARGAPTDAAAFIRGVGAAEPPPLGRPAAVRDAPSPPAPVHPPTPAEAAASSGGGGGGSPRRSLLRVVEGETEDSVLRFLVGGLAGATAKTIIAPLDRVKIIFQISHKPFSLRSVWNELVTTARTQGAAALFRGNAAQILRVYPYSGIQLMAFDQYTRLLLVEKRAGEASRGHAPPSHVVQGASASAQLGPLERMLAGSAAGATSVAATYPLDCLRARLAVQQELAVPGARYKGMWHAVRSMSSESGVLSLYRGMAPTLLGILPYAGISFATYETLKQYSVEANWGEGGHVPNWQRLLFGGVGGLAGQVRTRSGGKGRAGRGVPPACCSS